MTHSLHQQVHQFSINIDETLCMLYIDETENKFDTSCVQNHGSKQMEKI